MTLKELELKTIRENNKNFIDAIKHQVDMLAETDSGNIDEELIVQDKLINLLLLLRNENLENKIW